MDTTNYFAVGVMGEAVVSLGLNRRFSRDQALNLAAWLVVMTEATDDGDTVRSDFDALVAAVRAS